MATLGANNLTIADAVKMMGADGKIRAIAELLHQKNGIVADIPWREGDTINGHMSVQETSLPSVSTRVANAGVAASKGTDAQTLESPERLEGWIVMDEMVGDYGGDPAGKLAKQASKMAEKFNQTVADRWIYGNDETTFGQLRGLAVRYNSTTANNGDQIILCGGSQSDNSSIWIIGHAEDKVYGWYPKGTSGGLKNKSWGKVPERDSDGNEQAVWKEQFNWDIGLAVDDHRFVSRLANIDISNLVAGSGADLFEKLTLGVKSIYDLQACRPAIYLNMTCEAFLDIQARNDVQTGGQLKYEVVGGKAMDTFRGIPLTRLDRLTEAEATIS